MSTTNTSKPNCCAICGNYLTTVEKYAGSRCVDPAHWQAAGVLTPGDFYPMARIASWAKAEFNQRLNNKNGPTTSVLEPILEPV